jgi:hypothetical protein
LKGIIKERGEETKRRKEERRKKKIDTEDTEVHREHRD